MLPEKKRILVTGGAGFLGSHLVDRLLAQGHHVTVVDNLHTGNRANFSQHHNKAQFEFIDQDVCIPLSLALDEIYNLACPASPVHYQADPIATMRTSFMGALNALELARVNKARIFHASTSEVYGDPLVHPQPESYWGNVNPCGIRACYDEGKRCAETLFYDYRRKYGLDIRVARIFNTYGPRMHPQDGRVVSNFIVQALKGEDLTIYGNGHQTRSFCYVDDLVTGVLRMMSIDGPIDRSVNLGNDREIRVVELAELVLRLTKSKSKMITLPPPEDDPQQRKPVLTSARELLDWQPKTKLEAGVTKTVNYFRTLLNTQKQETQS